MAKVEPIIKKWVEYMDAGKIMGLKCKTCGQVQFPPVPVCNECSGTDMEWVEMSGNGVLQSFLFSIMGNYGYTNTPCVMGYVMLDEGKTCAGRLLNVTKSQQPALLKMMQEGPVHVKMSTELLGTDHKFFAFTVVEKIPE